MSLVVSDYYFLMEGSLMTSGSTAILTSPKVPAALRCLKFNYYMYGLGIGLLSVSVENESGTDIVWRLSGPQQKKESAWKMASVNISLPDKSARRKVLSYVCNNISNKRCQCR